MVATTITSKKLFSLLIITLSLSTPVSAEIVLDGTLSGYAGQELQGPDFAIEANLGEKMGNNLFHSFETFNINHNESATFYGPTSIENIISRVTGGQASYINGLLASKVPANMYFLNPAGVILGEHARLDVQGSLHISTADYLRLGITGRFAATHPENTLLTIAPPTAFGFLDTSPAPISKQQSVLKVQNGKNLSFIGGDLTIEDKHLTGQENAMLNAPDGQINLISVASAGEVPVVPAKISDNAFERFGSIKITDVPLTADNYNRKANVDVSGTGGGNIYIRGEQIVMENVYVWADTAGKENGQGITIKATDDFIAKGARITTEVTGTGNGGNINIAARKVTLTDGAQIATSTRSSGNSGKITMTVKEATEISGFLSLFNDKDSRSGLLSNASNIGNGGQIFIKTPALTLADYGTIYAGTKGTGQGGQISLNVGKLYLRQNGTITAESQAQGNAGHISLHINDWLQIQKGAIKTETYSADGGNINITSPGYLYFTDGEITTRVKAKDGDGGNITLHPEFIVLDNSKIIAQAVSGDGGNINIKTTGLYKFSESLINASSQFGLDGIVSIDSPDIDISDDLLVLPKKILGGANLLNNRCAGFSRENLSRFLITIRDVAPPTPEDLRTHTWLPF
jgi:filamentous hemagglutinin family protein